jgi:RNA polymerase subunit RPABC4/transcription elongation factor Spt4
LLRPHNTLAENYERELAEEAMLQDLGERHICPKCHRRVESDFIVCPNCHQQLRLRCLSCERLLSPKWDICPYCGVANEPADKDKQPDKAVKGLELLPAEPEPLAAAAEAVPVEAVPDAGPPADSTPTSN